MQDWRKRQLWDVTEDDYDKVMNVNLKGAFFVKLPSSNTSKRPNALARLLISVQSMKNYLFPISLPTAPARVA